MARNFYSHVRSDRAKWIILAIALVAAAVILCAIFTKGFTDWNPFCWFGHDFVNGTCTRCHTAQTAAQTAGAVLNAKIGR